MRIRSWAWLLAVCLVLAGCQKAPAAPPVEPAPPVPAAPPEEPVDEPLALNRLTVEVVVDWEDTDRILSGLEELSRLLSEALGERACLVDELAVTIGTAGGITGDALASGGVDAAFLPGTCLGDLEEGSTVTVLESEDSGLAAAVTAARQDLAEPFLQAFSEALTETEAGRMFLELCYPGSEFTAAAP